MRAVGHTVACCVLCRAAPAACFYASPLMLRCLPPPLSLPPPLRLLLGCWEGRVLCSRESLLGRRR